MGVRFLAPLALIALIGSSADARPRVRKPLDPKKVGSSARVNYGRDLRPTREKVVGRKASALTEEEATAERIQTLLRGPILRRGITGLYVADANTGEPILAVNADDPLNPASNVKMISTATALDLLGPTYRYPTLVLGPDPVAGTIKGDVYLLGSYDPMLALGDFGELAEALERRGVTTIEGSIITGADPTRDGLYRASVPIEIVAGEPGSAPSIHLPPGFDLVTVTSTATTAKRAMRPRLTYKVTTTTTATGQPRIELSIKGTIGKGGKVKYPLSATKLRTAVAAYALAAELASHNIKLTGEWKTAELGDFVGDAVARGELPIELARHESIPLSKIVERINKWSINWLADRVVMTAAALTRRKPPTMDLAVSAMYRWLERHAQVSRKSILLDTGSGLSYRTQISSRDLVSVIRSAGGFTKHADPAVSEIWRDSLAIAGTDGTLRYRFRTTKTYGGQVVGKTGTLSTVIALSGILDLDPKRPLAFSLVTNTDSPLSKRLVRKAHELVIAELCKYLAKTSRAPAKPRPVPAVPAAPDPDEGEETDDAIDHEAAGKPQVPPVKRSEELPL